MAHKMGNFLVDDTTYIKHLEAVNKELITACKYVVKWHREHDSGEGELFGLDFVTTCINAINTAEEVNK